MRSARVLGWTGAICVVMALGGCASPRLAVRPPALPATQANPDAPAAQRILQSQLHQFAAEDAASVRRR